MAKKKTAKKKTPKKKPAPDQKMPEKQEDGSLDYKNFPLPYSPINKQRFLKWLEAYVQNGGRFKRACLAVNVSYSGMYTALKRREDWKMAKQIADEMIDDGLEEEAITRAVEGYQRPVYQQGVKVGEEPIYSDRLLEVLLKHRLPRKYADRAQPEPDKPPVIVQFNIEGVERTPQEKMDVSKGVKHITGTSRVITKKEEEDDIDT